MAAGAFPLVLCLVVINTVPGEKWLITELNGTESSYMPVPEVFGTDVYPEKLTDGSFLEPAAGDKLVAAVCDMITQMK